MVVNLDGRNSIEQNNAINKMVSDDDDDDDEKTFEMRHNIVDGIMINIRSHFFHWKFRKVPKREKKNPISQITFDSCQCLCVAAHGIILNNMISKSISLFSSS